MVTAQQHKKKRSTGSRAARTRSRGDKVAGMERPGPATVREVRRQVGLTQRMFSRMFGVSERTLIKLENGERLNSAANRRLCEIQRLQQALARVVSSEAIAPWLEQPNDAFDGLKPLEVIERGQIDRIWAMVFALESGVPG